MARLQFDVEGIDEAGRRLGALAAAGRDLRPVFEDIGEWLVRTTKDRFRDQKDPEGAPWTPLSENYRRQKKRNKDKILTLDGFLSGSINFRASSEELLVGSPLEYAGIHQFGGEIKRQARTQVLTFGVRGGGFVSSSRAQSGAGFRQRLAFIGDGTTTIPARPFLGVSAEDRDEIQGIVTDYLLEVFNRA